MSSPQTATPFGRYLLIKRLALGGMAELFLAHKPPDPTLVVIKRILPYLSEEPEFVQMFLDEARIAAQLHHPNIVQVHELGIEGDNIFICMEYVEGVDLRRVLAEEFKFGASMPYGVAAKICAAIAAGLDHAHFSRGVDGRPLELIHRDVSPQNVMISYDGRVKLVDFGIAKAGAFMERSKPGVIKGKFLYLSPEQILQERLDHRADIYALGVMLYEITTGKQPFHRPTTEGILYAIRYEEPPPPHLVRPDYPEALSRIVMRCLVKDRTQRYQRASEVRATCRRSSRPACSSRAWTWWGTSRGCWGRRRSARCSTSPRRSARAGTRPPCRCRPCARRCRLRCRICRRTPPRARCPWPTRRTPPRARCPCRMWRTRRRARLRSTRTRARARCRWAGRRRHPGGPRR
ncbi:serine/threonine-protein kinase [Corallococcus sp. NCRR]|uniref:serine/threonine-protein kinase n=1 Tax=Corallococcus sp. NCRR TaxID=2996782 RepID=UPI0022A9C8BA|nr:serine/threonine-protein kinase [Corallococcus sp. NCRR]WAS84562.1 serine/threonine-protein kinase [Corallococcus sp. NCRR]